MTRDFEQRALIASTRVEEYDGTTAVTRGAHLDPEEVEFMRWKAERWIKVRHIPAVLQHDPMFVARNWWRMLGHTFRGTSWRSALGLENARDVFRRYRALRARERNYLDWPDPLASPDIPGHAVNRARNREVSGQLDAAEMRSSTARGGTIDVRL